MNEGGEILCFVDVIVLLFSEYTYDSVVAKTGRGLKSVDEWRSSNFLCLNINKTKALNFSIGEQYLLLTIKLSLMFFLLFFWFTKCDCSMLEFVGFVQYLGIAIDKNFKFIIHSAIVVSKFRKLFYKC